MAFVADKGDNQDDSKLTEYPVNGYIEVQPGKKLALIKVNVPKEEEAEGLEVGREAAPAGREGTHLGPRRA